MFLVQIDVRWEDKHYFEAWAQTRFSAIPVVIAGLTTCAEGWNSATHVKLSNIRVRGCFGLPVRRGHGRPSPRRWSSV